MQRTTCAFAASLTLPLGLERRPVESIAVLHSCAQVVLAVGHSARPLYHQLLASGVEMEPKAFAMGFRIEHPQVRPSVFQSHLPLLLPRSEPPGFIVSFEEQMQFAQLRIAFIRLLLPAPRRSP